MSPMTPTLWLILGIAVLLLAGSVFMYFKARHEAGQALECRTADFAAIERQTSRLQASVPDAFQRQKSRAGAPASYDAHRTNDRRVADINAFRHNITQVETEAAAAALIDLGRGVRRANPYPFKSSGFVPWQIAYEQVRLEREQSIDDSEARAEVTHG